MIKKLQRRFVLYTILAITATMGILFVGFALSPQNTTTIHRTIILTILIILMVTIFSIFLCRIAIIPIKKAWQQQLDFTADASHELRTPLAVIQSSLEILMEDPDMTIKEQEKWITNIRRETGHLNGLVDDLLTLSRADSNETDLNINEFPLKLIVDEQEAAFEAIAQSKQIEFQNQFAANYLVHADARYLSRLFRIFIDNSMKYMGRPGVIRVSAENTKKYMLITYSDDGMGIPAEETEQIFRRFYRVDKARSRCEGGSGLGLAIAKWIVDIHQGEIIAKGDTGKGVTFEMKFPK